MGHILKNNKTDSFRKFGNVCESLTSSQSGQQVIGNELIKMRILACKSEFMENIWLTHLSLVRED